MNEWGYQGTLAILYPIKILEMKKSIIASDKR